MSKSGFWLSSVYGEVQGIGLSGFSEIQLERPPGFDRVEVSGRCDIRTYKYRR